jgi:hypothetical protein
MMANRFLINGFNVSESTKFTVFSFGCGLLLTNHYLLAMFSITDYPYRRWVSVAFLFTIFLFSIGNLLLEGLLIGLSAFVVFSGLWNLDLISGSYMRKQLFIVCVVVLILSLVTGRISLTNLLSQGYKGEGEEW